MDSYISNPLNARALIRLVERLGSVAEAASESAASHAEPNEAADASRPELSKQREHHADQSCLLAQYRLPHAEPFLDLRPFARCVAEYNCHLVCCPLRHAPAIDAEVGQGLAGYLLSVAKARKFDVISLAILDDHLHLFAALRPNQSPDYLAFAVMNNASYWIGQRNPGAVRLWNAPGFWSPSAFVRTAGAVTTNQVRGHLQATNVPWEC